ncbi:hypothetical protein B0T14DRAFT_255677 [Immersiella caudata]|uniref:Uncharacterized protein n=1 Tax=Immersiella caudata TaxID=314043 RepID=A0AA39WKD1_9PEZI|nr:hypothetical protein B0T14DRAFT_255677 [Immersiella caudata]
MQRRVVSTLASFGMWNGNLLAFAPVFSPPRPDEQRIPSLRKGVPTCSLPNTANGTCRKPPAPTQIVKGDQRHRLQCWLQKKKKKKAILAAQTKGILSQRPDLRASVTTSHDDKIRNRTAGNRQPAAGNRQPLIPVTSLPS